MTPRLIIGASILALFGVFVFGWRAVDEGAHGTITQSRLMEDMYVLDVKDRVRSALRDPSSAIFRSGITRHPDNSYCGLVSAKNGLGGYADAVEFHVGRSGEVTFDKPRDVRDGVEGAATRLCKAASRV